MEGEIPNLNNTYPNKSNNPFFARDAAYSDSKDLADRTIWNNYLKDRAYENAINCKDDYF